MTKLKVVTASVMLALTGSAFAVPAVTDYDDATSAYQDAYVSGQFNLNSGNQEQTSYDLDVALDYEQVFSSPDLNTKIDFLGSGSRYRGPNDNDEDQSYYQALGSITADKYFKPGSHGAFYYGKGEVGLQKGQEDPFTKAMIGLGYGRVVNVTPMARAIRLIEALRLRGSLTGDPSNAMYQEVAVVIDKENEYRSKYGATDYEQYWVEDIENALKKSGMVEGGGDLGAGAVLKSFDVLVNERISTRKKGWLVRAGVGVVFTDYDGENGKPALEVGAEYHYPIGNSTQFSDEAIITATLDDGDNSYIFNNAMSLTNELTDRVDWENQWILNHAETDVDGVEDITTHTLSSTFRYYLTNQLDLNLTARLQDLEDNIDGNNNDEWDKSLNMGITYRLR
jgi:ribosome-associated protein YbcJ (S4-like RNA binding protein)